MYRKKQNLININIVMDLGGLGDLIATLPVIKYIYDHHPQVVIHFWVPDFAIELCERSLPRDRNRMIIRGFKDKDKFKKEFYGRSFAIHKHTNLGYHATKQAFGVILNEEVEDKYLNYLPVKTDDIDLTKFNLPEKYVVISTGFTAPVREFLPQHINKIIKYIKEKGYNVVFLGKKETSNGAGHTIKGNFKPEIDFHQGLDLVDKTSLVEARKILSLSKCVVGLDNGILHLAATTEVPIVCGYTTVKPMHREPYRHDVRGWNYYSVVPPETLACRFCQSHFQFTYQVRDGIPHDFKTCFYKERGEDTKIRCTEELNSDLYIEKLKLIL